MKKYRLLILIFLFLHSATYASSFITLADIHFDPFLSCTTSPCPLIEKLRQNPAAKWPHLLAIGQQDVANRYWQDSSYSLLISALASAKQVTDTQQMQFVLVLGDFLAHQYKRHYKKFSSDKQLKDYPAFVQKTLEFLAMELRMSFPGLDIYAVVGNNDSSKNNYASIPHGVFFKETAMTWSGLITNKSNRDSMQREFPDCGYYAFNLPSQHLRLIVLNTNIFSYKAQGRNIAAAVQTELTWLSHELILVKEQHEKALISMHIPPIYDIYTTPSTRLFTLMQLWKQSYMQQFYQVLRSYSPQIMGIVAGHLHIDWMHILTLDNIEVPIMGTPSISPLYGNNPGFKVYTYSENTNQFTGSMTYKLTLNGQLMGRKQQ